ncbi:hypothetical protein BEN49_12815 [Hymenobacter coccineus]|uniref:Uncharacterized protein n=1 Tax=Hymenobacter coccineus TaxID=1908235 RepID=A0A1G1SX55_9BACT|nr:hypothetical protein BEN49_12815 [Hymenobacter coccineus]
MALHEADVLLAVLALLVGVGQGRGVDEGEAGHAAGVALGQGQGHVAAHAVGHEQHGVGGALVGEVLGHVAGLSFHAEIGHGGPIGAVAGQVGGQQPVAGRKRAGEIGPHFAAFGKAVQENERGGSGKGCSHGGKCNRRARAAL